MSTLFRLLFGDQQLVKRIDIHQNAFANNETQSITNVFPSTTAKSTSAKPSSVVSSISSVAPSSTLTPTSSIMIPLPSSSSAIDSSASTSATSSPDSGSGGGGISGGAIGAIVAVVVIVIGGVIAFFVIRRRRNKRIMDRAGAGAMRDPYSDGFEAFPPPPAPMAFTSSGTSHEYNNNAAGSAVPVSPVSPMQPPASYHYVSPNAYNNNGGMPPPQQQMMVSSPQMMQGMAMGGAMAAMAPHQQQQQQQQPYNGMQTSPIEAMPPQQQQMQMQTLPQQPPSTQPGDIWQQQPLGTYAVSATYTPTLSDEIEIQVGDQVQVFEEYDDGWCLGVNVTRGQTRGVFPKHCVNAASSGNASSGNLSVDDRQAKAGKRVSSLIMDGKAQLF